MATILSPGEYQMINEAQDTWYCIATTSFWFERKQCHSSHSDVNYKLVIQCVKNHVQIKWANIMVKHTFQHNQWPGHIINLIIWLSLTLILQENMIHLKNTLLIIHKISLKTTVTIIPIPTLKIIMTCPHFRVGKHIIKMGHLCLNVTKLQT